MRLTLVVPCYNEQDNVVDFCKECVRVFSKGDFDYDFVFVNDGSTDKTLKTLREIYSLGKLNMTIISFSRNFGKGHRRRPATASRSCYGDDRLSFRTQGMRLRCSVSERKTRKQTAQNIQRLVLRSEQQDNADKTLPRSKRFPHDEKTDGQCCSPTQRISPLFKGNFFLGGI